MFVVFATSKRRIRKRGHLCINFTGMFNCLHL